MKNLFLTCKCGNPKAEEPACCPYCWASADPGLKRVALSTMRSRSQRREAVKMILAGITGRQK